MKRSTTAQDGRRSPLVWLRLAASILVVVAVVHAATSAWFDVLFERLKRPPDELDDHALRLATEVLQVVGLTGYGTTLVHGCSLTIIMLLIARVDRLRIIGGVTALAFAASTLCEVRLLVAHFADVAFRHEAFVGWYQANVIAHAAAWAGTLALVALVSRDQPRRHIAIACAAVGAVGLGFGLYGWFVLEGQVPPSWWRERWLGLTVPEWCALVGSIGTGAGLWLASRPHRDDEARGFDAATARGLRLARTLVWWRVGLALAGGGAALYGMTKAVRSIGFGAASPIPLALRIVPWLAYVEVAFTAAMVVGLTTVVLQRRSQWSRALAGVGTVALLVRIVGSFALNMALHLAIQVDGSNSNGWAERELIKYRDVVLELEPVLGWLGLFGMSTMLAALIVLARTSGCSSKRALRFVGLAVLTALAWRFARDRLDVLGGEEWPLAAVLLAAVLLMAIRMIVDLTTFLGELADAVAPREGPRDRTVIARPR